MLDSAARFEAPRSYHDGGGCALMTLGPYVLWWLKTEMDGDITEAAHTATADLLRDYRTIGYLALFEPEAAVVMPAEYRRPVTDYVTRYTDDFFGVALVYEASGFRATVVRSVITAVTLASRARHPVRVVSTLQNATEWLETMAPSPLRLGPSQLLDAVSGLRKQYRETRPQER